MYQIVSFTCNLRELSRINIHVAVTNVMDVKIFKAWSWKCLTIFIMKSREKIYIPDESQGSFSSNVMWQPWYYRFAFWSGRVDRATALYVITSKRVQVGEALVTEYARIFRKHCMRCEYTTLWLLVVHHYSCVCSCVVLMSEWIAGDE